MNSPTFSPNKESNLQPRTISPSCLTAYLHVMRARQLHSDKGGLRRTRWTNTARPIFHERAAHGDIPCLLDTLDSERELTYEQEKLIKKTALQIEYTVPDIKGRVEQARDMTQDLKM